MSYNPESGGGITDGDKGDVTVSGSGAVWEVTTVANEVVVKSASDLPTPSGGVITLDNNTAYIITGTIDIGTDRIVVGTRNTIRGNDRQNDILTSSNAGNMFTMDNSGTPKVFLVFDNLTLSATAGALISVTGGTTDQVTFISCTISSTVSGGTITGCGFSMRTSSISSAFSTTGFVFSGTNLSFVLRDSTVSNNTGTAFDFTSATFSSAVLISRVFINTGASQTFLNATGTTVSIAGQIALCIFTGAGTYLTGLTAETANWLFSNNQGITNSISTYLPSITGNANKKLQVNAGETGTEWVTVSGGSGNFGTTTIDFGAFPGTSDASVTVTGQSGIVAGSVVSAWLRLTATADHSADEHWVETIQVYAGNIVAGTGFTIYAKNTNQINEPSTEPRLARFLGAGQDAGAGQQKSALSESKGTRIYGQWNVQWSWG